MPPERRLVLVGAGHAHLHLLRHASRLARAGIRTTLVAPGWFDYSGAASAIAAGARDPAEGRIDVAALARRASVEHLACLVTDVDLTARTVTTSDGSRVEWDLISFNIGSIAGGPLAATSSSEVVGVKPLSDLAQLRDRLQRPPAGRGHRITVIGAGPSGIELAAHLAEHPATGRVHLLEGAPRVGGFLPRRAADRVVALLEERGVRVMPGAEVERVADDAVHLDDGTRLPHDIAVLSTGLAPAQLATRAPLGGRDGFPVRATLQHRDHDDVYAAGDCADFLPGPLPRIGVHGVRQGPVLLAALEARASGAPDPVYRPPRQALSILDLGAGTALAVRGRWWWLGPASLAIKGRIDQRWLAGYRD